MLERETLSHTIGAMYENKNESVVYNHIQQTQHYYSTRQYQHTFCLSVVLQLSVVFADK